MAKKRSLAKNFWVFEENIFEKWSFGQKKRANGQKWPKKWAEKMAKNALKSGVFGAKSAILG